jgi:hypothetical protein
MGLTRPKIWDLDTSIEYFKDPITTLHQGATSANVDVGFIFNRANGLVSNVALYWSESTQSMVVALTANTGVTDSNVAISSFSNITMGNVFVNNRVTYMWQNNNASAAYQVFNSTTNSIDTIFGS